MRVHAKSREHVIINCISHGGWCQLIVVCTICVIFICTKMSMPSDDLSLAGCKAWYQAKGVLVKFRNLVRSWFVIRQLIFVWSSRLQQWMMTGVSILAGLCCLIVENNFSFCFVHEMVGAWSSARPPEKIKPGKLWEGVFTPGSFAAYVDLW